MRVARLARGAAEERVAELAGVVLALRRRSARPMRMVAPRLCARSATNSRVLGGRARAQAMVEVRDVQVEAELRREAAQQKEERGGVRAAGDRDDDRSGRQEVVLTHEGEDRGADRSSGRQRWLGWDSDPRPVGYESTALGQLSYPAARSLILERFRDSIPRRRRNSISGHSRFASVARAAGREGCSRRTVTSPPRTRGTRWSACIGPPSPQ